ncbi:hypothetical protein ZWY2020_058456 [Hordeum vulgare]|nr:hypothetical protein ZWY2020_058456 [Hordeum vulgare]
MVKERTGQRVRLYVRGTILGFKRQCRTGDGVSIVAMALGVAVLSSRDAQVLRPAGSTSDPPVKWGMPERTPMMRFSVAPTTMGGMEGGIVERRLMLIPAISLTIGSLQYSLDAQRSRVGWASKERSIPCIRSRAGCASIERSTPEGYIILKY